MAIYNPNLSIVINKNITLTPPTGPAVIAIMGTAQWGPLDSIESFSSFNQILDIYKDDSSTISLTLIKGVDILYNNGASTVKVVRVADGDQVKALKAFAGAGPTADVLTFTAKYFGTYGNNITITITAQGTGRIVTITDGVITEEYTNTYATDGYATNAAIATAINTTKPSQLVTVTVKPGSETTNLVDAVTATALISGDSGENSLQASDYTTAFDSFLANELWDILVIPGADALEATNAFQNTMLGKVNTRATNDKKYGVYMSGVIVDETLSTIRARAAAGSRLVLCAPSLKYTARYANAVQDVINGTYLACAVAGLAASQSVAEPITRKIPTIEGLSVLESSGKEYYNNAEIEELLSYRVIPLSLIEGAIKIARGVTRITSQTDIEYELGIVRIIDVLRAQFQQKLDPFLGRQNIAEIRKVMASECDAVLELDKRDKLLNAYLPSIVNVGISPDTVDVEVNIYPVFAINFIRLTISISRL